MEVGYPSKVCMLLALLWIHSPCGTCTCLGVMPNSSSWIPQHFSAQHNKHTRNSVAVHVVPLAKYHFCARAVMRVKQVCAIECP